MTFSVVSGSLAAAVANSGTFTVSYPSGKDAGSFYLAMGHKMMLGQNKLVFPDDFNLTFGASNITVTNAYGSTWAQDTPFRLQLEEQGTRVLKDVVSKEVMASETKAETVLVNLGAPDVADADGYCVSQDLTAAGVFSTDVTAAAAIAAAALAGTADQPRNVVAAWTTTSVLTVTGTDVYGNVLKESSASGTSFTGKKAFKTVTGISVSVSVTSLTVGSGNVLGLPVFLPARSNIVVEMVNAKVISDSSIIRVPFTINATDLNAHTAAVCVMPVTGDVTGAVYTVAATLPNSLDDIGTLIVTAGGTAVDGLTVDSGSWSTSAAVGTSQRKTTSVGSTAGSLAAGGIVTILPGTSWASAGAISGYLEVTPKNRSNYLPGTVVAGIRVSNGSTATSGDVRGTYTPSNAPDGSDIYQLICSLADPTNIGIAQYIG